MPSRWMPASSLASTSTAKAPWFGLELLDRLGDQRGDHRRRAAPAAAPRPPRDPPRTRTRRRRGRGRRRSRASVTSPSSTTSPALGRCPHAHDGFALDHQLTGGEQFVAGEDAVGAETDHGGVPPHDAVTRCRSSSTLRIGSRKPSRPPGSRLEVSADRGVQHGLGGGGDVQVEAVRSRRARGATVVWMSQKAATSLPRRWRCRAARRGLEVELPILHRVGGGQGGEDLHLLDADVVQQPSESRSTTRGARLRSSSLAHLDRLLRRTRPSPAVDAVERSRSTSGRSDSWPTNVPVPCRNSEDVQRHQGADGLADRRPGHPQRRRDRPRSAWGRRGGGVRSGSGSLMVH